MLLQYTCTRAFERTRIYAIQNLSPIQLSILVDSQCWRSNQQLTWWRMPLSLQWLNLSRTSKPRNRVGWVICWVILMWRMLFLWEYLGWLWYTTTQQKELDAEPCTQNTAQGWPSNTWIHQYINTSNYLSFSFPSRTNHHSLTTQAQPPVNAHLPRLCRKIPHSHQHQLLWSRRCRKTQPPLMTYMLSAIQCNAMFSGNVFGMWSPVCVCKAVRCWWFGCIKFVMLWYDSYWNSCHGALMLVLLSPRKIFTSKQLSCLFPRSSRIISAALSAIA